MNLPTKELPVLVLNYKMNTYFTRRRFLGTSIAAGAAVLASSAAGADAPRLRIAPFRFDVTAPVGHPLCGGWITPAVDADDSLEAIGFVLLGAGKPIVICAVDWTGILNDAHVAWRTAIAARMSGCSRSRSSK